MKSAQWRLNRLAVALTWGVAGWATAQTIELSSQSIGTVLVTPGANRAQALTAPTLPGAATNAATGSVPARNTDTRVLQRPAASGHSGIDLGISPAAPRNADGSLFDALDPAQNPAAVSTVNGASTNGVNDATTNAGVNGSSATNSSNGVGTTNDGGVAGSPVGTIGPDGRRPGTSDLGNPTSSGTNNGNSATNNGRSFPGVNGGTGINNSGTTGNGLNGANGARNSNGGTAGAGSVGAGGVGAGSVGAGGAAGGGAR